MSKKYSFRAELDRLVKELQEKKEYSQDMIDNFVKGTELYIEFYTKVGLPLNMYRPTYHFSKEHNVLVLEVFPRYEK